MNMRLITSGRKTSLITWLTNKLASGSERLFRSDDAAARACGWQISPGRFGWSRSYRDPRFDALARREP